MLVVGLLLLLQRSLLGYAQCEPKRGCNAPLAYSNIGLDIEDVGTNPLEVYTSSNHNATIKAAIEFGSNLVRNFLGTSANARVYYLAPGGSNSDYDFLDSDFCTWAGRSSGCADSQINAAKSGGGEYYVSTFDECLCSYYSNSGSPVWMLPSTTDDVTNVRYRAVHEYVHAVQATFGGPLPTWLIEGGAVFMECVMASEVEGTTFSNCFRYGGGGGGILQSIYSLYNGDSSTTWFTTYAEDRACGSGAVPPNGSPTNERAVYYDLGAYAIAFAIHKANASHASDGGRTFLDFWRSNTTNRGLWHNIEPYGGIDSMNGWASDVPDTAGWKAALLSFTGMSSYAEFCAAFEAHVLDNIVTNNDIASLNNLSNILESDDFVAANDQSASGRSAITSTDLRNACSCTASGMSCLASVDCCSYSCGDCDSSGGGCTCVSGSSSGSSSGDDNTVVFVGIGVGGGALFLLVHVGAYYAFCKRGTKKEDVARSASTRGDVDRGGAQGNELPVSSL
eukprot:g4331.t1